MGSPIHHGAFPNPTDADRPRNLFPGRIERAFTVLGDLEPNRLEKLNNYSERLTRRKTAIGEEHSRLMLNA
jgi:hypothetical protein